MMVHQTLKLELKASIVADDYESMKILCSYDDLLLLTMSAKMTLSLQTHTVSATIQIYNLCEKKKQQQKKSINSLLLKTCKNTNTTAPIEFWYSSIKALMKYFIHAKTMTCTDYFHLNDQKYQTCCGLLDSLLVSFCLLHSDGTNFVLFAFWLLIVFEPKFFWSSNGWKWKKKK